MASVRNRFFVEGILLGGLCGVVLGSLIAFQVGNERVKAARSLVERVVRREPSVPYVHIRQ
jgi:ABC-type lipoprotein release transport system permease subunit